MSEQKSDYKRGYEAGYQAGLRRGQTKSSGRIGYRRQYWRCNACGVSGMVLFRSDDQWEQKRERLRVAHANKSKRRRCADGGRIALIAKAEGQP